MVVSVLKEVGELHALVHFHVRLALLSTSGHVVGVEVCVEDSLVELHVVVKPLDGVHSLFRHDDVVKLLERPNNVLFICNLLLPEHPVHVSLHLLCINEAMRVCKSNVTINILLYIAAKNIVYSFSLKR